MLKDPHLNALKAVHGYALTCHKGQGEEWNEVFLYLDNKIHGIKKPRIYQRFYTAMTRAKRKFVYSERLVYKIILASCLTYLKLRYGYPTK
jgi:hypothetical protein